MSVVFVYFTDTKSRILHEDSL